MDFLHENRDAFAWSNDDLQGVPRELADYSLFVRPVAKLVKQSTRRLSDERRAAIMEHLVVLLAAGFVMEVLHPDWLSNLVLVEKKKDDPLLVKVWRMCIDFTNLNKACPKDPFPLPRIDQVIDSTAGCELLSFLDAYSGFHQIPLNPADQLKTAFITSYGAYCYRVMTFGLINAGATYQRCMQKGLIGYVPWFFEFYLVVPYPRCFLVYALVCSHISQTLVSLKSTSFDPHLA